MYTDANESASSLGAQDGANEIGTACIPFHRPVHEWYRFVLSFPPHSVRNYLQRFEVT